MEDTVSCQFARFVTRTTTETLPPAIAALAKVRVLDSLSTAIAATELPVPTAAASIIGNNTGNSTVIGRSQRVPAADAAFVNATLVNGRTQDDFLCKSHPGAVTVPPSLAVAEQFDRTGADVIASVVVGYELTGRAYLGGPDMLPRFRATGVAGAVGAAAASAKAMKLDIIVQDRDGKTIFESGALNADGSIAGNANDADPHRYEPHYREITRPQQVEIFEPILGDAHNNVTTGLLSAVGYLKDNRLLPQWLRQASATRDIAVVGNALDDPNFTERAAPRATWSTPPPHPVPSTSAPSSGISR